MVIHKCDRCGKEMSTWMTMITKPDTNNSYTNIYDLLVYQSNLELCKDCYLKVLEEILVVEKYE